MVDFFDPNVYNKSATQSVSGTTQYDPWVTDASKSIYDRALGEASKPYAPYSGQRVAALDGDITKASEEAGAFTGEQFAGEYFDPAKALINDSRYVASPVGADNVSTQRLNAANLQGYINPYVEQAIDPVIRDKREQYLRDVEELKRTAGMTKAFGGSRQAIKEMLTKKFSEQDISDTLSRGYKDAFDTASQLFMTDEDRALKANLANQGKDVQLGMFNEGSRQKETQFATDQARALGNLGSQFSGVKTDLVNNLMKTGKYKQDQAQLIADKAYEDYLDKRDWDKGQIGFLASALSGVPLNTTKVQDSVTSVEAPSPSDAANVLGSLSGLLEAGGDIAGFIKGSDIAKSVISSLAGGAEILSGIGATGGTMTPAGVAAAEAFFGTGGAGATGLSAASTGVTTGAGAATGGVGGAGVGIGASAIAALPALAFAVFAAPGLFGRSAQEKAREASSIGSVEGGKITFEPIKSKRVNSKYVLPLQRDAQKMVDELNSRGIDTSGLKLDVAVNSGGAGGQGQEYANDLVSEVISGLPPRVRDMLLANRMKSEGKRESDAVKKDKNTSAAPVSGFITVQGKGQAEPTRINFINQTREEFLDSLGVNEIDTGAWGFNISDLKLDSIMTKDDAFGVAQEVLQGSPLQLSAGITG